MDKNIKNILTRGLTTKDSVKRKEALDALRNQPSDPDKIKAIAALKDENTNYDDIGDIESGEHFDRWKNNNIKEAKELAEEIIVLESLENIIQESDTWEKDEDNSDEGIFNIENDLFIDSDPEEVLDFLEQEGRWKYNEDENKKSQSIKRIETALRVYNNSLHKEDRDQIKKQINKIIDRVKESRKKKNLWTKKQFIDAVNKKLSDEERIEFLGILIRQIDDIFSRNQK